jgi:hypothetical protein
MLIKLLDSSLIRRFGKTTLDVDSGVAKSLIDKKLAVLIETKVIEKPEIDKMIRKPEEKKSMKIFPETIISEE